MGCFLGCFGFTTKKQKRIKPCNKFQVHQKYVPLESEKANAEDSANSEPRDKPKESSKRKVKKKVSFNLDVKTYERIQDDDNTTNFSEEEEKTQREYNEQKTAKASMSMYPSSYRYYNCNDSYDEEEEDEITLEDSDIDDLDEEEEEDYGVSDDDDDGGGGGDEYNSLHIETENKYGNVEKLNKDDESNEVGRNHRNSVLLPVENLTQWKAVKGRGAQQVKHQKENIVKLDGKQELPLVKKPANHCVVDLNPKNNSKPNKPQGHEIPVDASLSNWLVSARTTSVNGSAVYYIQDRAVDQVVLDEVNII